MAVCHTHSLPAWLYCTCVRAVTVCHHTRAEQEHVNCTRIGVWVDIRYSDKHLQSHPHILCEYICVCLSTYSCVCTCMYTREHLLTYSRCLTVLNILLHTHPHEYITIVSHIFIHTVYSTCVYCMCVCAYVLYICFQLVCAVWVLLLQSHSAPLGSCM